MRAEFHPEAQAEYRDAARYLERKAAAGGRFVQAVQRAIDMACAKPHAGAFWPGLPIDLAVRRRRIPRFKHMSLAYMAFHDVLWIVAVVPERRRPGYWFARLQDLQPRAWIAHEGSSLTATDCRWRVSAR